MKYKILICFFCIPFLAQSQIGREFKSSQINGDFTQCIEKDYENLKLDNQGKPIIPSQALLEYLHFYENGWVLETQCFEYKGKEKELSSRILIQREDSIIKKATVYYYRQGKEKQLREHRSNSENGQIVSEEVYSSGKNVGSAKYQYGKKNSAIKYEVIQVTNLNRKTEFYTESDQNGVVFSAQINNVDTIMRLKRIEQFGDSIYKSILVNTNRTTGKDDSILLLNRTWFDSFNNPIMNLKQMTALTEPPPGEPKSVNYVSTFKYLMTDKAIKTKTKVKSIEMLYGGWKNAENNIDLFFEPEGENGQQRLFGSSYLSKSNEPTVEEHLANQTIWIFMLKQEFKYSHWKINENGELMVTLNNGSVLKFIMEFDYQTLILKPQMEDLEGELRLTKTK